MEYPTETIYLILEEKILVKRIKGILTIGLTVSDDEDIELGNEEENLQIEEEKTLPKGECSICLEASTGLNTICGLFSHKK